jgi:hypothetical protein
VTGISERGSTAGNNVTESSNSVEKSTQQGFTQIWPEIDASYFQLDRATYDLFDDSLSGTLRDLAARNYVPFTLNDNACAGNDSHFTAHLVSPVIGLGNQIGSRSKTMGLF